MFKHRSSWVAVLTLLMASLPSLAQFSTRPPDNGAPGPNYIPDGTRFIIRLDDNLDSHKAKQGKKFKAELAEDLQAPDGEMIPRGSKIRGHISDATSGLHGRMLLSFNEIETRHGWMPLLATVSDVPGEHGVKTDEREGEISRNVSKQRIAETAVTGAAIGATAGAIAGGGRGAAIGAGAGGALGAGGGALLGQALKLPKGTQIELRLDRPLEVPTH